METAVIVLIIILLTVCVLVVISGVSYGCYLHYIKWRERRRLEEAQAILHQNFVNTYNEMINEVWRCSNQNNRWW